MFEEVVGDKVAELVFFSEQGEASVEDGWVDR